MEKKERYYKRRQYFVAKKFQLKYVSLILLLMFLTAAMCSYVVYYTSMILMGGRLADVYPQGRLVSIVKIVNLRILLSVVLVTPLVALIGVFLSHRIAGPINRMERFMGQVVAGDLSSRLILRRKDELIILANGINSLIDKLRENIMAEKIHLNKVSKELEGLKKSALSKQLEPDSVHHALIRLDEEIKGINNTLDRYILS